MSDAYLAEIAEQLGPDLVKLAQASALGALVPELEWARDAVARGAGEILLTSMDRDGTKLGFDVELTAAVAGAVGVPVIASGGVGTLDHLVEGVTKGHASAVLAASIFHFGTHSIAEAHAKVFWIFLRHTQRTI